uniref:Uncharacterized protein n=1 Tax=Arundo donax TaxID=35708 RepID=A0A0A9QZA7_ARUDO
MENLIKYYNFGIDILLLLNCAEDLLHLNVQNYIY